MKVENSLECRGLARLEQIQPIRIQGSLDGAGKLRSNLHNLASNLCVDVKNISIVLFRNDKEMSRIRWVDIHKSEKLVFFVNLRCWYDVVGYCAKYAVNNLPHFMLVYCSKGEAYFPSSS